ncbi:uncharacterized protein LOC131601718 [Vicia villosa]|uniref:uncharacterized protein LOC131601718 n=1 Tax=Vicia villosa TaxID=3911 RepID=UPI00273BCBAC|nr:uncharacterized protein LOC131601718 [Vicia villosa]XP_058729574.1 uncharacterized protein LOC131601718 [Vicia villosa]
MFKFSCFHVNVQGNKTKKITQPSTETMARVLRESSKIPVRKDPSTPTNLGSLLSKQQSSKLMNVAENDILNQDSVEHVGKLEDLNKKFCVEFDGKVRQTERLRKSQSESVLCQVITEGDQVLEFSKSLNDSPNSSGSPSDEFKTNSNSEFQVIPGRDNDGSSFSVGDPTHLDMDAHEISDTPLSGDLAGDSAENTSGPSSPTLRKSHSLPNFKAPTLSYGSICVFKHASSMSRSSDDLCALGLRNVSSDQIRKGKECSMKKTEDFRMDRYFEDSFDSHLLSHLPKDRIMPITDDISDVEPFQGDSSAEFPNKDFKVKRIEDWVIGLQQCAPPLEDIAELPEPVDLIADVNTAIAATPVVDHKISPGMEAAKRYISSLTANASAAQLASHGLVAIPFLSAFVSLKVLNLSGNGIVKITAGALPRGLHTLNLSKNNISTIEGLRELTRLRVLDLSYNRILRIGHGLASCSSLKELYLAGNKIGEVEGLHRLLKISILDLRFNKISTAKCLGQLAANYNSLLAINLEGNPCQKNVGDEQIKKYLQGLLPHLVYYNRQPFKANGLKDSADRAVRLGMSSQQFDRGLRVDRKTTRKVPSSTRRPSSGSSPKHSKGKQGHLPPMGTKPSSQSRHHLDSFDKALSLKSRNLMRKSRSEGTLGAF